ncbi:MAG: polyprenol monophosphomannose synthase [Armatimonadota bacterium]
MISIVIPTYNESNSIKLLIPKIFDHAKKADIDCEVIIVDDNSPDGTGAVADELGQKYNVKTVHRRGKLGLSSAVLEGFKIASGDILGVMDADLSHDPAVIPGLVKAITEQGADISVGSRYVPGGDIKNWPWRRLVTSKGAILLSRVVTNVKDSTSGFFFVKKECIDGVKLNPIGFKIGLEIFVKARAKKITEVPYVFTDRASGTSKFNFKEIINYLVQLQDLVSYKLSGNK